MLSFSFPFYVFQNTHSFHNNGYIHAKNVDVSPSSSGKGVVLTTRKQKAPLNQIKKANQVQTLKAGSSRQNNKAIATAVRNYRADQLTVRLPFVHLHEQANL